MSQTQEIKWPRITIEAAVIVVSILLAFSIQAWWELRSQQAEARAYIEAVRTELIANRETIIEDLKTLRGWVEESELYLNTVVAPNASPSYDEVREMVWKTGPNSTIPLARSAIDDLVSSGGFQSIDLAELRRALADYARSLENDAAEQEDVRDFFNQFIYPYHLSRGSFTEFDWEEYNELPESPVSFPLDVDAFAGNRTYANLLISRILEYGNLRDAHRDLLEKIDQALSLIDSAFQ